MTKTKDPTDLSDAIIAPAGVGKASDGTDPVASDPATSAVHGSAIEERLAPPHFKIDLFYTDGFSAAHNSWGIVSLWGSGGDMPLADFKVYECPREGCLGLITPGSHASVIAACPKCATVWRPLQLVGERLYCLPVQKWAVVITQYLHRVNMDADLYLKRLKTKLNIIEADAIEREKDLRNELLDLARHKETAMYTRDRLLVDVAQGASVESAVRAFLLA